MENARIKVIHVIDGVSQGNHGIIEAALGTAGILAESHGITSELWFPKASNGSHRVDLRGAAPVAFRDTPVFDPRRVADGRQLCPRGTVVVTHGCWRSPTLVGARLKEASFPWVYTPHGMLEPWSLRQKALRKKLYWELRERRLAEKADVVRATAVPERDNLARLFSNVSLLTHGIEANGDDPEHRPDGITRVLFMGRLHPKKGAVALARAWTRSCLYRNSGFQLIIVGNDDGDLPELKRIVRASGSNMVLREPVYGKEKAGLFASCSFFALPSRSEGFPMALLEGMAAGLIPLISHGCNLPEVIESGLALAVSPEMEDIVTGLDLLATFSPGEIADRQTQTREFIRAQFSLTAVASQQARFYRSLLV